VSIRINPAADYSGNFFLIKLSLLLEEHQGTIESRVTKYFASIYFQRSSDFSNYFIILNKMGECMCVAFVFVFVVVFVAVFVVATVVMSWRKCRDLPPDQVHEDCLLYS